MTKADISFLAVLFAAMVAAVVVMRRRRQIELKANAAEDAAALAARVGALPTALACCIRDCTEVATRARPTATRQRWLAALMPSWVVDDRRGAEIDPAIGGLCPEHHDLWVHALRAKATEYALAVDAYAATQDREFINWLRVQLPKDQRATPPRQAVLGQRSLPSPASRADGDATPPDA